MIDNPNIKVFISSTFRDLNIERDYIVQKIFPEIRAELDGINVSEVDLRWGITDEESREKRVVDLCLQYLYESKPFFVGILGERYGSTISPDNVELSPLVSDAYPHVWDDLNAGLSITEIEILNGVLRAPRERKLNAIFFIMETDKPYMGEDNQKFQKLQSLKKRIKEQTDYPFYIYNDLEDLDKLKKFILDNLDNKHISRNTSNKNTVFFQNNLCLEHYRRLKPHNLAILDHLIPVLERAKPVAILEGIEGSGKSSLVAQLGSTYKGSDRIFLHMYGNIPNITATCSQFTSYFLDAARHNLKEKYENIANQQNLKGWFKRTFQSVNWDNDYELLGEVTKHKWCIVLDNVSSLRLKTISPMPYIIRSITEGMSVIQQQGYNIDYRILLVQCPDSIYNSNVQYETLSMPSGCSINSQVFIDNYLSVYSKHLSAKHKQVLRTSPLATHPRSLFLVCEYMRESITHEQLSSFIDHIATFKSTSDVYRLFLERLKNQLSPDVLRHLLGLISLFSYGLNLRHLQELSGLDNLSFHRAWCSIKKLVREEPTGAIHWTNVAIANIVDDEFNLKEEGFRLELAKKCFSYFFDTIDKLFTPEKLAKEIRNSWWLWKSQLISSIPKEKQDKSFLDILGMHDIRLYSYLSGKGCFKSEHIRKYVYPTVQTNRFVSEFQNALRRARKQGITTDWKGIQGMFETGDIYNFYKEGFWEQISRYRKPTQVELLCYLETLCICKNWKQLEVELANPEVLNYVYSTSVLLDCWFVGMNKGGISIIQPDMKTYDKMLLVSYALRNAEGIKYYSASQQ